MEVSPKYRGDQMYKVLRFVTNLFELGFQAKNAKKKGSTVGRSIFEFLAWSPKNPVPATHASHYESTVSEHSKKFIENSLTANQGGLSEADVDELSKLFW